MRFTLLFKGLLTLSLLLGLAGSSFAQTGNVSGHISGPAGEALIGATAALKGTTLGAGAGPDGSFTISNVPNGSYTLTVSFIGYKAKDVPVTVPGSDNVAVTLATDATSLSDVVVTGVFDERTKMAASVAITTLDAKQIERQAPNSAVDLLKNVPGVFVNSSLGEVRNAVSTRGIAARTSYTDDLSGLYYVSLQEDGLPVSNIFFSSYTPDLFYRADATVKRLEAVRGGTASITGANAPGGIFNYLSKTGAKEFGGEVRLKYGLEGNGRNPYYRTDVNVGGPLGGKGLSFNVGGFYRTSQGPRYPGYQTNYGGQVKANVEKKYENGALTLYVKYLNDHNGTPLNLIGRNFDNPQLADGVNNNQSFALPKNATLTTRMGDGAVLNFDPSNQNHAQEIAAGLNWRHSFGSSFFISNNVRYSHKDLTLNITQATNPITLTDFIPNAVAGNIGVGVITYRDNQTKQVLATVRAGLPPSWTVLNSNLPGQDILPNGMLYQAAQVSHPIINEFQDQLVLTKKLDKMSFNLGAYVGIADAARFTTGAAGIGFTTIEDKPRMLDISFVNALAGGSTQQITSPEGFVKTGGAFGVNDYTFNKKTFAPFFAHTWQLTDKLTFDWGLRFEHATATGTNAIRTPNTANDGGLDKNPLTIYDNGYYGNPQDINYSFTTNTLSYSGALNYLITENQSVYGRYSVGKKAPDFFQYQTIDAPEKVAFTDPAVQKVLQAEVGYKVQSTMFDVAATPFYSRLDNILQAFTTQDANNKLYNLQPFFNSIETYGVEMEGTARLHKNFSVRGVATFQQSKFLQFKSSTAGPTTSKDDDTFVDYSGNYADNTPKVLYNITPTFSTDKFFAYLTYQYTGDRWANAPNAFILKGYSELNLGAGYTFNKHLDVNLNINNLANSFGVMSWGAPGGFPAVFNRNDFTVAAKEANKSALFPIGSIQPRAYFLTANYRF